MMRITGIIILLGTFSISYASTSKYYCGGHDGFIQTGDTIERVRRVCGYPLTTLHDEHGEPATVAVQRWYYPTNPTQAGMVLDFYDGKVINITNSPLTNQNPSVNSSYDSSLYPVTGLVANPAVLIQQNNGYNYYYRGALSPVQSTQCRMNGYVHVGDSVDYAVKECGRPYREIVVRRRLVTGRDQVTRMTYNNGPNTPQTVLSFKNGLLERVEPGDYGY